MDKNELPERASWALHGVTKCGQQGYLRPCQLAGPGWENVVSAPHDELCAASKEMVIVVEDDKDMREELVAMARAQGRPAIGVGSAKEFYPLVSVYQTGCVVLDVNLPGQDGLEIQLWLNSVNCSLPVIFLSGVKDVSTVAHGMKAGALEFISKPFGEMELRRAINTAVGLSRQRHCMTESKKLVDSLLLTLTPTEREVATMMARGYPTKLVAAEMGRSENTTKIHRHRIFSKLKITSVASVSNILRHVE